MRKETKQTHEDLIASDATENQVSVAGTFTFTVGVLAPRPIGVTTIARVQSNDLHSTNASSNTRSAGPFSNLKKPSCLKKTGSGGAGIPSRHAGGLEKRSKHKQKETKSEDAPVCNKGNGEEPAPWSGHDRMRAPMAHGVSWAGDVVVRGPSV